MNTRRYNAQFAAVTLDLEQQLKGSSPCAKALVRWLLLRCKPGCTIEFELQEFADYSAIALRNRPYSLRHIWRALVEDLRDRHIIEVVKQYTWQTWKVRVVHPNLTNPSSTEEKTVQNQSEMSELQPSTTDAAVPAYRGIQKMTNTTVAVVDLKAQAHSRSHPSTSSGSLDEEEESASGVGKEAIAVVPTGGAESTLTQSSGVDSDSSKDLPPELLAQVQQAIAPAVVTPPLLTLVHRTEAALVNAALKAARDYRKTHTITNPIGLLITAIRQQWQPQQPDRTTPPEFNAWFNWARSRSLVIASQQLEGMLHVYAADGQCYPYTEFAAAHPMPVHELVT